MKIVNLIGQQFGKLTVIEKMSSTRDGSVLWKCLCECGSIYQATTRHLNRKNNNVKSCGCNQFKKGENHSQWEGHGEISGHWWSAHIKHSANCNSRKKLDLSLTKKEAWDLFLQQDRKCAFTGEILIIDNKSNLNTASVDRIDNTKGYHLNNVRWVHKTINMMKRIYSDSHFINQCNKVTLYTNNIR